VASDSERMVRCGKDLWTERDGVMYDVLHIMRTTVCTGCYTM